MKKLCAVFFLGIFLLILAFFIIRVYHRNDPSGYVASDKLLRHDPNDVLEFNNGKVTLHTCCGEEDWGTYARNSKGGFTWKDTRTIKNKIVTIQELEITPKTFSLKFIDSKDTAKTIELRRRIFRSINL